MYKYIAVASLSIMLALSDASTSAHANETLRLTTGKWQPYTSKEAPHEGVASQIVREAFALVDVQVEYGFFPWKRAMKLARDGKWDGTIIWYDTEERRANFFYSDPVAFATNSFFHLKSYQFSWSKFEDLAEIRVGGTLEYSYGQAFDDAEKAGVFTTHRAISDEVGLTNLLKGRIDVFPGETLVTHHQIRDTFSDEDAALFTHHAKHISELSLHLLLSRKAAGMQQIRDRFNEGLKMLKQSGRYDQILAAGLAAPKANTE